jgi:hypothetical protein
MKKIFAAFLLFCLSISATNVLAGKRDSTTNYSTRKHQLYFYWGWNRGFYSKSDIHFTGENYNFTLKDVVAHDRQTAIGADPYLQIGKITIPQTDIRIGFYINDHWEISLGDDHMKYVMIQNQVVNIDGYINQSGTDYDGTYSDDEIALTKDFLIYEHTDGLNYLNLEVRRSDNISKYLRLKPGSILQVHTLGGLGAGIIYPRTNCTLLNNERHDEFHVAGYGIAPVAGINLTFFRHLMIQGELKGGFINLPDVRTTSNAADKAKQHFWFFESLISVGACFQL